MTHVKLKIGRIPDSTPSKVTVPIPPALEDDLKAYAQVYSDAYGEVVKVADMIPVMLRTFIDSDAGFKRARKKLDPPSPPDPTAHN